MLFNRGPYYAHWQTKPVYDANLEIDAAVKLLIFFLQARIQPAGTESSAYSLSVVQFNEHYLKRIWFSLTHLLKRTNRYTMMSR